MDKKRKPDKSRMITGMRLKKRTSESSIGAVKNNVMTDKKIAHTLHNSGVEKGVVHRKESTRACLKNI